MEDILFILFSIQKLGRQMLWLSVGCLVTLFLALSPCSLFICLSRSPFFSPFPSFFLLLFLSLLGPTSYKSEILMNQICHRNNAEFGINKSLSLIIWKQCLCPEPLCRGGSILRSLCCEDLKPLGEVKGWPSGQQSWYEPSQPQCQKSEHMRVPMIPSLSCWVTSSFCIFPTKALGIVEHRWTGPIVPFPNSWPMESMIIIKWWYTTIFKIGNQQGPTV